MEVSGISKAAEKLADIVKDAAGILVDPVKKIMMSEAEFRIEKRKAQKEFEIDKINLINRAKIRMFEAELQRQFNLEGICQHALNNLNESSEPEKINRDWLNYFFSCSQDISEESMKEIWGKILAEESQPNKTYSRITLERLKVMSAEDCQKFQELSRRVIWIEDNAIIVKVNINEGFTSSYNYKFIDFLKLVDLGLISKSEIAQIDIPKNSFIELNIENQIWYMENESGTNYNLHFYMLTTSGKELIRLFKIGFDTQYLDNLRQSLRLDRIKLNRNFQGNSNKFLHDNID